MCARRPGRGSRSPRPATPDPPGTAPTGASDWGDDIRLWDVATGRATATLEEDETFKTAYGVAFGLDGEILASG
ncbi:hypothetical protein Acsp03_07980 [Actinomadura sp. NBRC 104412]|nr:hypothetical protein Acsp03_07980 [Actinomadura sp. NBRC 104412]